LEDGRSARPFGGHYFTLQLKVRDRFACAASSSFCSRSAQLGDVPSPIKIAILFTDKVIAEKRISRSYLHD